MHLPTLYKKNSNGSIQQWTIGVTFFATNTPQNVTIVTNFGQVGGKMQEACDLVTKGKNVGRANETTPLQQAEAEAQSQWEKKLKKGYVKTLTEAEAGKVDEIIEGGVNPMLAHKFSEHGHKIVYPAFAQPKFDGHRCIAVIKDGKATLWTRTRKPITGLPHIIVALETVASCFDTSKEVVLDGELYNHDYRAKFEELTSFIRNPEPKPGYEAVQYHIYDVADLSQHQLDRTARLSALKNRAALHLLIFVETVVVNDEDELMLAFESFLKQGYEGAMVRNMTGMYVGKRSYDLLKVKEFDDGEFEVVGVEAGRGKMADKAIFVCKTSDGTEFRAKMKGSLDDLKKFIETPALAVGKKLTVQYQGITNKSSVPRFPVGLRLREET